MVKPVNVETLGSDLLIRLDDGTRVRAIQSVGEMWIVGQVPEAPVPKPPPSNTSRFIWPFPLTEVTSEYGMRNGRLHAGIDFGRGSSNSGGPIPAASNGKVIIATNSHSGYGNTVVLDHGQGLCTLYAHMLLGSRTVKVGDVVTQGQKLGNTGNTGASRGVHLHFETHEGGYRWNASSRNPRTFFAKWNK